MLQWTIKKSYDSATTSQKKNYHTPVQQHNHTNPTATKIIQSLNSHGHFGHPRFYSAHPKKGYRRLRAASALSCWIIIKIKKPVFGTLK